MKTNVEITVLKEGAKFPFYATEHSAGMDLVAAVDETITLQPLERTLIGTGIAFALPDGYEAQIRPRSGLAYKRGLTVLNAPGTIDADYRGEVKVLLVNLSNDAVEVEPGERVAQLVVAPYTKVQWSSVASLDDTVRAAGGFGSTGTK